MLSDITSLSSLMTQLSLMSESQPTPTRPRMRRPRTRLMMRTTIATPRITLSSVPQSLPLTPPPTTTMITKPKRLRTTILAPITLTLPQSLPRPPLLATKLSPLSRPNPMVTILMAATTTMMITKLRKRMRTPITTELITLTPLLLLPPTPLSTTTMMTTRLRKRTHTTATHTVPMLLTMPPLTKLIDTTIATRTTRPPRKTRTPTIIELTTPMPLTTTVISRTTRPLRRRRTPSMPPITPSTQLLPTPCPSPPMPTALMPLMLSQSTTTTLPMSNSLTEITRCSKIQKIDEYAFS